MKKMHQRNPILSRTLLLTVILLTLPNSGIASWLVSPAKAQTDTLTEKEAFNSTKELGTLGAWKAFLKSYPTGFFSDLARAYVQKIGTKDQVKTKPPAKPQAVTPAVPSAPPAERQLSTFFSEPGSSPWRSTRYEMDEGNASARAAAVEANGVELILHCSGKRRMGAIIRESIRGRYPEFDKRIRQGLAAGGASSSVNGSGILSMSFSTGSVYNVYGTVQEINGEVSLDNKRNVQGFLYNSGLIDDMMSAKTVSIEAPPFVATLQLKRSRSAICAVARKCGAKVPGCKSRTTPTITKKKTYKKKRRRTAKRKRTITCSAGKVWNGTTCQQSLYHDKQGKPLDGYYTDAQGNVHQDNGGGGH